MIFSCCHPCHNDGCPQTACPDEPRGCVHGFCAECEDRCPDCREES